jgi:hypothetical protein
LPGDGGALIGAAGVKGIVCHGLRRAAWWPGRGVPMGEVFFVWLLYTAPVAVAIHRRAVDRSALAVVNLVTGWTVLGWFVCLLWAALGRADRIMPAAPAQP